MERQVERRGKEVFERATSRNLEKKKSAQGRGVAVWDSKGFVQDW